MIKWILVYLELIPIVMCVVCSQCDSDTDYNCRINPPPPANCTACSGFDPHTFKCSSYYDMQYCIIERRYLNDSLVRITRDCSPLTMRSTCRTITEHGHLVKVCFSTCRTSGCNSKSGPSIVMMNATNILCTIICVFYSVLLPKLKIGDG